MLQQEVQSVPFWQRMCLSLYLYDNDTGCIIVVINIASEPDMQMQRWTAQKPLSSMITTQRLILGVALHAKSSRSTLLLWKVWQ
jgi:hypothetical protein